MTRTTLCTGLLVLLATPHACAAPATNIVPAAAPLPSSAASQDLDDWLEKGRRAIDDGRLTDARELLEQAAALDKGGERSRVWLMRLEIAEGGYDDVLTQISTLRREGTAGPDYDYLLGMALAERCRADLAAGGSGSLEFMLQDAKSTLVAVCEQDAERYRDAHEALAEMALALGDHETGVAAGERAVSVTPERPRAHLLLGKARLGWTAAAWNENPSDLARVQERAAGAEDALLGAVERIGEAPATPELESLAADAWNQVGTARAYAQNADGAADAYREALVLDPETPDLNAVLGVVGPERFRELLAAASEDFVKLHGSEDARDATLKWWYGWSLYDADDPGRFEEAEQALETALEKVPEYRSAHYYLALLRLASQDYEGSLARLRTFADAAPDELVGMIASDGGSLNKLLGLLDHFALDNRLGEAAFVAQQLAEAYPTHDPYWNNLGLFLRDHGSQLAAQAREDDAQAWAEIEGLWERSYGAYLRALSLKPDSPAYLNDTAVLLHYYLERDYDKALDMYASAAILAEQQLAAGEVPKNEVAIVETALRDAKNNRRLLEQKIGEEQAAEQTRD